MSASQVAALRHAPRWALTPPLPREALPTGTVTPTKRIHCGLPANTEYWISKGFATQGRRARTKKRWQGRTQGDEARTEQGQEDHPRTRKGALTSQVGGHGPEEACFCRWNFLLERDILVDSNQDQYQRRCLILDHYKSGLGIQGWFTELIASSTSAQDSSEKGERPNQWFSSQEITARATRVLNQVSRRQVKAERLGAGSGSQACEKPWGWPCQGPQECFVDLESQYCKWK